MNTYSPCPFDIYSPSATVAGGSKNGSGFSGGNSFLSGNFGSTALAPGMGTGETKN